MTDRLIGHDFAAERAQRRHMRTTAKILPLAAAAWVCALFSAGAACAQSSSDAPLATAGSTAGGVPTATEVEPSAGPPVVQQTPTAAPVQPLADVRDLEAAADQGRKAPLLGDYHGEVSAVVGTNGLRGVSGEIVTHPAENLVLDLRFSALHQNGVIYNGFYGPGVRSRPGLDAEAPAPGGEHPSH